MALVAFVLCLIIPLAFRDMGSEFSSSYDVMMYGSKSKSYDWFWERWVDLVRLYGWFDVVELLLEADSL